MAIDTMNSPTTIHETATLTPTMPAHRDSYSVLDHRARDRAVSRSAALPGHHLAFTDEAGEKHLISLDRSITHLGRSSGADIVLDDARVSRRHAIVVLDAGNARVLDDRSAHGTFVNDKRTAGQDLHDGDVIRLGPVAATYLVIH